MAPGLGMNYGVGAQTRSYRFTLPVAIGGGQQAGVWHAVLAIDRGDYKKALSRLRDQRDQRRFQSFATHGARYSVSIQTYSNLRMQVRVEQSSFEPGAALTFQAVLTEYGIPVEKRAQASIELTRPGGSIATVPMTEIEPGIFEGTSTATFSGVYFARIMAKGVTLRGTPFTREHTASLAVWKGGDDPYRPPRDSGAEDWCRFLSCLLSEKILNRELEQQLKKAGVSLDAIRHCVQELCRGRVRRREGQ